MEPRPRLTRELVRLLPRLESSRGSITIPPLTSLILISGAAPLGRLERIVLSEPRESREVSPRMSMAVGSPVVWLRSRVSRELSPRTSMAVGSPVVLLRSRVLV